MENKVDRPAARLVTGRIKVHPDGFGFVVPEDGSEDVHVNRRSRDTAMDSDRVEVEWWVGARGLEGRVTQVLERGRGKITGQIVAVGTGLRFQPDDPRITEPVVLRGEGAPPRPGVAVVAKIIGYPTQADATLKVSLLKVLGTPEEPRTEIEKILACGDIEDEFPAEVARAALRMPDKVEEADRRDRADLRDVAFMTIDPETARDFDDAVALQSLPGGVSRLWVAVADVSHYLREGTALDAEARKRGCSLYLPDRAIPMLPEALSAHLCSLVPEQDRLAMVARIDFDKNLGIKETDFCAAVIHSQARLDYPGVAAALAGKVGGKYKKYEPFLPTLRALDALARRLRARRQERGALDLDLPQVVVELDRDDPLLVRDIRRARRDPGERHAYAMIEEFMLAANLAVGESFEERHEPTLWRIHPVPDAEKLRNFAAMAERYGIRVDEDEVRTPLGLAKLLHGFAGHAAEKPLSFQLLRSLKQATYDVNNVGHFGLAAPAYLHFTSPIRRYPDVVVHRLLKHRLASLGKPAGGFAPLGPGTIAAQDELPLVATESSFCERKAMEIEREVVDLYRSFFMRDRVGDVLTGSISGVASFGVFVVADEPFVEGLIRTEHLWPDDFYDYDEVACRLVGRRSGHTFSLGDPVKVEVVSASVARRQVDLRLEGPQGRGKREQKKPSERSAKRSREKSSHRTHSSRQPGRTSGKRR
ncbi:MAG TPA: ribonuclease R [Polyangia bacterium]